MPLPLILTLAAGGVKYGLDKAQENRDRELNAKQTELSAWTKRDPSTFQQIREADLIGTLMQAGMTGASFEQNLERFNMQKEAHELQKQINENYLEQARAGRASIRPVPMSAASLESDPYWSGSYRPSYWRKPESYYWGIL